MQESKVLAAKQKYIEDISTESVTRFSEALKNAKDECFDGLMNISIKSKVATLMFSLFLGGLGVDRFYLGDYGLGASKLICNILTIPFMFVPTLNYLWLIFIGFWCFVDIFCCWERCKEKNYDMVMLYLRNNKGNDYCNLREKYLSKNEEKQNDETTPKRYEGYRKQPQTNTNLLSITNEQIEVLKKLKEILDMGVITQEEYDKKKAEIMDLK